MPASEPIKQHRTLSLMPTYRCTAQCKSCGTLSSPHATERLESTEVLEAIRQASEAGIELVVFTGGEATLEWESLLNGLRCARSLGMHTRLVTNAHWAIDDERSKVVLEDLDDAGLNEINFSTGDQHSRFVPVEDVLRGVRHALGVGFTPAVMVEVTAAMRVTRQSLEDHPYQRETQEMYPGRVVKFNESPWMPLKPSKLERYPSGLAVDRSNLGATKGCDSVLQTVTIQADGSIGACCGLGMRLIPELNVGDIRTTSVKQAIVIAEEDLLKRWIRLDGPEKILAWAAQKDSTIEWEGMYAHRCQACLRLYKDDAVGAVLREHLMEEVPNILFGEYLLYGLDDKDDAAANSIASPVDVG